jgi:enoyl-CoA hydratase/carnithine racemase
MTIRLERRGSAVVVTIDRPDQRNALSRQTVLDLGRVGRELAGDDGVRLVVLTGAGDKAFCAGADLKERATMSDDDVRDMLLLYASEFSWLEQSPFPVVAALNGAALGGGLELALTCELRVAAAHAVLGLPETSLGIIPAAGGTQRLPRLVGHSKALELVLLGARIDALEARAIGLVNRVSPAETPVVDDALAWLSPIIDGAPIAQRAALVALRAARETTLRDGLELERRAYEECLASDDRREALRAFAEKRKPVFRGR